MNNWIVLAVGLASVVIINFIYCVVLLDDGRRKGTSPLEFLWLLYWVNLGALVILAPAWLTAEILRQWPDWVLFIFVGGPILLIAIMLLPAWGYVRRYPYTGGYDNSTWSAKEGKWK